MSQDRIGSSTLMRVAFLLCAIWPVSMALLWLGTGRTVPTVNIRWVSSITGEQRLQAERDLAIVWHEPKEPGTVTYFLPDTDTPNFLRIVTHPLVEDTAFINRRTGVLEDPPYARMWMGDRFTTPWPSALLYASLFGCAIIGVRTVLRD